MHQFDGTAHIVIYKSLVDRSLRFDHGLVGCQCGVSLICMKLIIQGDLERNLTKITSIRL